MNIIHNNNTAVTQMKKLPSALKEFAKYDQFILWTTATRNGKLVKLPVSYKTGKVADAHDPDCWTSADEIFIAAQMWGVGFNVGFVFTKHDPFYFLDLDKCLQADNTWTPLALHLIARLPGAAVEISQSGHGLHIFGTGLNSDHGCKNIPLNLELYTEDRFVALTGTSIQGDAATNNSATGQHIIDQYFPVKKTKRGGEWRTEPVADWDGPTDDDELIKKMINSKSTAVKFGTKASFRQLWEGDTVALALFYPDTEGDREYDESSVDMALAVHCSFWTGCDHQRILDLMLRSGLVREKWERKDYLIRTITRAVSIQDAVYIAGSAGNSRIKNIVDNIHINNVPKGYQPLDSLKVKSLMGLTSDHFIDAHTLIMSTFENRLSNLDGILYYWNGCDFELVQDQILRRLIGLAMGGGDLKVTHTRITQTLAVLKDQVLELGEPNPVCINIYFKNGVLNPITKELSPHNIKNRNTYTLSVNYDSTSESEIFNDFINTIFSNDFERTQLFQELIGFALCSDNLGIEKSALLIGPPRAGKGVIARIIFSLLGSAAIPFDLSNLDDNKRLSGMRKANVAIDTDAVSANKQNSKAVMGLFKIITGNEKLSILQLYKQTPWEGPLNCKMFVLANSVPTMWDDSSATANRWIPLVFDHSFLGKEDPNLFKKLLAELPGIATWAVEGLCRLIERGHFKLPKSSQNQLDSLISDGGSIQHFIDDSLSIGDEHRSSDAALWNAYRQWAISTGHEINKRHHILKSLEDALRGNAVRRAKSIKLDDGKSYRGFYGVASKLEVVAGNITPFVNPAN